MTTNLTIVTAADHRYATLVDALESSARAVGYETLIYDLGGLGRGVPWTPPRGRFRSDGYYSELTKGWQSRGLHKPLAMLHAMTTHDGPWLCIDADTLLRARVDEMLQPAEGCPRAPDICVTARRASEFAFAPNLEARRLMGPFNAGVVALAATDAAVRLVAAWAAETVVRGAETVVRGDDQLALNRVINPLGLVPLPDWFEVATVDGPAVVRTVPTDVYNFYYFSEGIPATAKVLHFKDGLWYKRQEVWSAHQPLREGHIP